MSLVVVLAGLALALLFALAAAAVAVVIGQEHCHYWLLGPTRSPLVAAVHRRYLGQSHQQPVELEGVMPRPLVVEPLEALVVQVVEEPTAQPEAPVLEIPPRQRHHKDQTAASERLSLAAQLEVAVPQQLAVTELPIHQRSQ